MKTAIIGGGAAGFFAAINLKELCPEAEVCIYEQAPKVLAKVAVTGGGRCNLTNTFEEIKNIGDAYPRGAKLMKRLLKTFSHRDAYKWFEAHGVALTVQSDHCVFPASQDAHEIIKMFLSMCSRTGISIHSNHRVVHIDKQEDTFELTFASGKKEHADSVIVTTGSFSALRHGSMLDSLPLKIEPPVPSLFSINIKEDMGKLSGTVVENASARIPGTSFKASGPLLVTHWGMSGPAVLKLTSYAARHLHECGYTTPIAVNWCGEMNDEEIRASLTELMKANAGKNLSSVHLPSLPGRLWCRLLETRAIPSDRKCGDISKKELNRLTDAIANDSFTMTGKYRRKEEFVTCGGVSLTSVSPSTLECRECPGLYLAGEALDIDGITGGFNLQAAWTTGFTVAKAISEEI